MNIQQLAQVGIDSFNDRSFQEKARELMAENVVIIDRPTGQEMHGIDSYIEYSEQFVTAIPDLTGTVIKHEVERNKVISRVRQQGKFTGTLQTPHGNFPGNGNPIDIEYRIEQEFNDASKVWRLILNYDLPDFMDQLCRTHRSV